MTNEKFPAWLLTIMALAVFAYLAVTLKDLLTLLAVSYGLAYLTDKPITMLERYKVPRALGFVVVCLALLGILSLLIFIVFPPLVQQGIELARTLPDIASRYSLKIQRLIERVSPGASREYFSQEALLSYIDPAMVQKFLAKLMPALVTGYTLTLALFNLVLLPIITFYLAVDFKRIHRSFLKLLRPDNRKTVARVGQKINRAVSGYLQGQSIVALLLAGMYSIGFAIVGVPLWLAVGVTAGLLNIVPYLGTIIGIFLAFGLLLVDTTPSQSYLGLGMVFVVVQFLEGNIITPKIVGEKVGLSPLVVLVAVLAFGQLFGLLGVIIAVPLTAALKVIWREVDEKRSQQEAQVHAL